MISGFPESLQIAESWWSDERRTTDLFFFGTHDTSGRSLVNPKIDEFSSRCLAGLNSCGISLMFCFIVSISVQVLIFNLICNVNRRKEFYVVTSSSMK